MNECDLPRGIEASSLVDISKLNLKADASDRVAMKISEAVLAEYASLRKPASLVVAGRLSDIFHSPIDKKWEWIGLLALDLDTLRERGFATLDESIPQLIKNTIAEQP
ncbi:MAG: hypothetical protein NTX38_13700 [Methylobacter sp.]|nr:hypothetical protein [Methylobacter sp.]